MGQCIPPTALRRLPLSSPTLVWVFTRARVRPRPPLPLSSTYPPSFCTCAGVLLIWRSIRPFVLLLLLLTPLMTSHGDVRRMMLRSVGLSTTMLPVAASPWPLISPLTDLLSPLMTPHTPPHSPLAHRHQIAPGTIGATKTFDEPRAELLYKLTEPTTVDIPYNPRRNATPRVAKRRH